MNGLIVQWGMKPINSYDITFTLAFSGANTYTFNFIAYKTDSSTYGWHYYNTPTSTGIKVMSYAEPAMWHAIGY